MKDDVALAAGFALAGFGMLGATVLLTPMRGHSLGSTCAVAALVLVVAASTALAGHVAGALATLIATLSYDFFLVPPYLDLKVGRATDRVPIVAVLVVGGGIVMAARRRAGPASEGAPAPSHDRASPSRHIDRVERLIEQRAAPRDLVLAVGAELTALLAARSCRFEQGDASAVRPRFERSESGFGSEAVAALLAAEIELPIRAGSHRIGCFVIEQTPDAIVPFAHRIGALILADHLGRALASYGSSKPSPDMTPPLA